MDDRGSASTPSRRGDNGQDPRRHALNYSTGTERPMLHTFLMKCGITSRAKSRIDFFVNLGSTLGKSIMHCR